MAVNSLILSVTKGIIAAVGIFLLGKLYIALEWALGLPRGLDIIYYIIQILIIAFTLKNHSLKKCSISIISFVMISLVFEMIFNDINGNIFRLIFGLDSEMGAGDGFMLLSILLINMFVCTIGISISFVLTLQYVQKIKRHKR